MSKRIRYRPYNKSQHLVVLGPVCTNATKERR